MKIHFPNQLEPEQCSDLWTILCRHELEGKVYMHCEVCTCIPCERERA